MSTATAAVPVTRAFSIVKGNGEGDREQALDAIQRAAHTSVEHVALRWHNAGSLKKWFDLDDLTQECRVVLMSRCVDGFRVPEGKGDAEVARIFGRYAIITLNNHLRDLYRRSTLGTSLVRLCPDGGARLAASLRSPEPPEAATADEREMFGVLKGRLSDEHFQIALLLYEGKSWREIGGIIGEHPGTLCARMQRRAGPAIRSILNRWKS